MFEEKALETLEDERDRKWKRQFKESGASHRENERERNQTGVPQGEPGDAGPPWCKQSGMALNLTRDLFQDSTIPCK